MDERAEANWLGEQRKKVRKKVKSSCLLFYNIYKYQEQGYDPVCRNEKKAQLTNQRMPKEETVKHTHTHAHNREEKINLVPRFELELNKSREISFFFFFFLFFLSILSYPGL